MTYKKPVHECQWVALQNIIDEIIEVILDYRRVGLHSKADIYYDALFYYRDYQKNKGE